MLGYDITHSVKLMDELEFMPRVCSDVILVRKTYPIIMDVKKPSLQKEKSSGKHSQLVRQGNDILSDKYASDENDKTMETAVSLVEDEIFEDANACWLDIDNEDYKIYRQQLHDETEVAAEMLIKSTQAKLDESENQL